MLGFEQASIMGDSALMSYADKHLSLYIKLCEWADSSKCLNTIGISNRLTVTKSNTPSKVDALYLTENAIRGMGQGIEVSLESYSVVVREMAELLGDDDLDVKAIVGATKACLNCLDHIIKCVKISEHAHRITAPSDIGWGDGADQSSAEATSLAEAKAVLGDMLKAEAYEHCQKNTEIESCSVEENQNWWVAYAHVFLKDEAPP